MKEKKTFRQLVDEKMAKRGYERIPDEPLNEQTNHMRFLPDNEFNIDSATRNWVIPFTPGVPTEDGWYVVKSQRNEYTFYETIIMSNGMCVTGYDAIDILSHAKLPEL